jgi:hypothetical protein
MRRSLLALAVALAGCRTGGGTPPVNPPTPPPPSPVCAGETHSCWHQPPGMPWVYACPVYDSTSAIIGVQNEVDKAKCPLPPTAPPDTCILSGEPTVAAPSLNTLGETVNAAMGELRPDCTPGGTCLLVDMTRTEWQNLVNAKLRMKGLCAGQHSPSTDEIAVAVRSTDPWQGFKVFAGDDSNGPVPAGQPRRTVVWSPEAYKGSWMPPGTAPPPPPAVKACSDPIPPKVARFNLKAHNRWNDSTALFYGKEAKRWDGTTVYDYCVSAGSPDKLFCPARLEGSGDRLACERVGVSGKDDGKPEWRSDGELVPNPENIFQASCMGGCTWLEVCSADFAVCTRCDIDPATGLCKVVNP